MKAAVCAIALALVFWTPMRGFDKKPAQEEGQFDIYIAGNEIGTEKYSILSSGDSSSSNSVLDFRNPADKHQRVRLETQLEMGRNFLPRSYQLKSDVDGEKGTIVASFSPGQAMFEYKGAAAPRKSGLLVGDQYTVLDTNIFHHFIFLARLFKYGGDKSQRFEVVIPQEQDNGILKISEIGRETIPVRGRKIDVHHLQADSGSLLIDLWVDDGRVLHKIAVPSKRIEVMRASR